MRSGVLHSWLSLILFLSFKGLLHLFDHRNKLFNCWYLLLTLLWLIRYGGFALGCSGFKQLVPYDCGLILSELIVGGGLVVVLVLRGKLREKRLGHFGDLSIFYVF